MVRIDSINSVNNFQARKMSFKGNNNTQTNPQVTKLPDATVDFKVKTPLTYSKTGEINFPYDTKAQCYKLSNGQKVIIVPQEGETVLRTYVNTGSMNEPDNLRGISHYIEHNLFNGSEGLEEGDFFKQVDKMGASTNASTGFAETNYYISSNLLNETDLENKIKLHASMLESPLFAVEKLEKEKGIVNSEINMITSNPQNLAVNKMLKNLYDIKSTSTDMIGGTCDNITNLKREDVVNYYNNNYYPANMVTVITGDVKPEETIKLISKYFTSQKQPVQNRHFEKLIPIQKSVREDIISDKATASSVIIGFNGPKSNDTKDRIYSEALFTLLSTSPSARINNKIKSLNSISYAETEKISSNPNDGRVLMFMAEASEENSEKVLKAIFNEIGNIENNPPTEKEMKIIKKMMLQNFSSVFENSFTTNDSIGTSILENNKDYLNNFEQIVNSMTAEDLVKTAKKYLDVNKSSITVVHPAGITADNINQNHKNASSLTFTGAKKFAVNPESVKEYKTANNYRLVMTNSKTDNVEISFNMSIPNDLIVKPSAAIVLTELLNEGTFNKSQEEFDSDLAQEGIVKAFSATEHAIGCEMSGDSSVISKSLSSLKEVIDNPRLTPEEFENVKLRVKDNILASEKSAYDKLNSELYKGLPQGFSKEQILKDLDTLSLDDVKFLHQYITSQAKSVIVISAPFDKKPELKRNVFDEVSKFRQVKEFEVYQPQTVFTPVEKTKVLTNTDFKNQAEIIQAYKFKVNKNLKDTVTINLLNTILGGNPSSRLFMDLREKEKLAYRVKSGYTTFDDIGVLNLKIGTTTENKETGEQSFDNLQKSILGFNRHVQKMRTEKVSEEELNNAKLALKNEILNVNHNSADRNIGLLQGANSPYGAFRDNQILEEIDKITVDDIYNAANYIFSGKPTYSIVATENTLNANKEFLNKLEV